MKYFISNKESEHLNFTKISEDEFLALTNPIDEELYIYPGTFEVSNAPEVLLEKISLICAKSCKVTIGFINLYQLFVNVANHNIDLGVGHMTCRTIKNPFNINAATNFLVSRNIKIEKAYLEDGCSIIKMECHV